MYNRTIQSGFSLIELLVSMTIFTIVVTLSTSTFLVLVDANNKVQNVHSVISNLTFALDSMTREIRTGYNYVCASSRQSNNDVLNATNDCVTGGVYLSVIESGGSLTGGLGSSRVSYYFDNAYYGVGQGAIMRRLGDGDGDGDEDEINEDWFPITSENVEITDMEFVVSGTDTSGDTTAPSVTIYIEGSAGNLEELDTAFSIQTSVTQRIIDI